MAEALHAYIDPAFPEVIIDRRMIDLVDVPAHKQQLWRPVIIVNANPQHNPLTHKVTGPVTVIEPTQVTDTYTLVALTQEEIDANKDRAIATELFEGTNYAVLFRVIFNINNNVRVLQGLPPLSAADFRNKIKAAL